MKGTGVHIADGGRGYLSITDNGSVRLGKFSKECVCDVQHCAKYGMSVGFWVRLSKHDNGSKILLGGDTSMLPSNTSGIIIYQTSQTINGRQMRYISGLVYLKSADRKWKCNFQVQTETWFYLTVTWSTRFGLRMFKDSILMAEQGKGKIEIRRFRRSDQKCEVSLSLPSNDGTTLTADYDDLVIWGYELKKKLIHQVYAQSMGKMTLMMLCPCLNTLLRGYKHTSLSYSKLVAIT